MKFRTFFQETKVKLLVITEGCPLVPQKVIGGGGGQLNTFKVKDPLSDTIF